MSDVGSQTIANAVRVDLNPTEFFMACNVGVMRRVASVQRGHRERNGSQDDDFAITKNIIGACGEMAAAKALGRYWDGSVNVFKSVDLPPNDLFALEGIQVRTMGRHYYDLLIRPGDADEEKFLLVTSEVERSYLVHGWILGGDAKRPEWLDAKGGRIAAYFVPQSMLRPIVELR